MKRDIKINIITAILLPAIPVIALIVFPIMVIGVLLHIVWDSAHEVVEGWIK